MTKNTTRAARFLNAALHRTNASRSDAWRCFSSSASVPTTPTTLSFGDNLENGVRSPHMFHHSSPLLTSSFSSLTAPLDPLYAIDWNHIVEAAHRIHGVARRTPVMNNSDLDQMAGMDRRLFFKVEAMQQTGSFKFRGALNATLQLLQDAMEEANGDPIEVVTHSSGNHATAVACAAQMASSFSSQQSVKATVVMPETAPMFKKRAVQSFGGTVVEVPNVQGAREAKVAEILMSSSHAQEIHSSQNPLVIAGQGTIGFEWMQQMQDFNNSELDAVIIPVGGGGMAAGNAVALRAVLGDRVKIILAEPSALDDAKRSLDAGELLKHDASNPLISVADGLKTTLGPETFNILREEVDDIFLVSERDILRATRLIWERLKVCIEPSAGVGVAVALYHQEFLHKYAGAKNVGIILCGGNVDIGNTVQKMEAMGV